MSTAKPADHREEKNMVGTPHKRCCRWAASLPESSRSGASDCPLGVVEETLSIIKCKVTSKWIAQT